MGGATSKLSQIENLYALQHHPEGDRFAAEREFFDRRIDGPASDAHRVLLNAGASELSPEQRDGWARFIVAIAARAPAAVEHARFGALQHFDEEPEEYAPTDLPRVPRALRPWRLYGLSAPNPGECHRRPSQSREGRKDALVDSQAAGP